MRKATVTEQITGIAPNGRSLQVDPGTYVVADLDGVGLDYVYIYDPDASDDPGPGSRLLACVQVRDVHVFEDYQPW